jgi:hypothetical protein
MKGLTRQTGTRKGFADTARAVMALAMVGALGAIVHPGTLSRAASPSGLNTPPGGRRLESRKS